MNKTQTIKIIEEVEARLALLKKELGVPQKSSVSAASRSSVSVVKSRGGSTEPIVKLIEGGFFDDPKTDLEVVTALKRKALTFKRKFVAVTLMRLVRKGLLERDGQGGSKSNPWKYRKP
ncbi:MAG: hypothetical protein WC217_02570 [Candidatus Paceibacterota bacterium]